MSKHPSPSEITVQELQQQLINNSSSLQLIDVREITEIELASIENFQVLPISSYPSWSETILTDFDPNQETVVLCHHGIRSAQMCYWLANKGFSNVKNVVGGIDAYSRLVDDRIPRY